jgi:hypothetical protein
MRLRHPLVRCAAALVGAVAMTATLTALPASAAPKPGTGTPITVMTRNVYLGGDITRPLRTPLPGLTADLSLLQQNFELRRIVDRTDFPARATLIANEVKATKPDMIGLQEVATWRSGAFNSNPPVDAQNRVVPTATTVDYDFLAILLAALRRAGEHYEVVNAQAMSDVEGPAMNVLAGGTGAANYRLTMHDVLLKRASSQIKVEASGGQQYGAVLPFDLAGKRYEFIRGYNWADVRVGAKQVRVINTHLESQLSSFAMWQAQELVATRILPAGRPVIMLCDCNSDPLNTTTKVGEPIPGIKHQDPYLFLRQHLDDAWLRSGTSDPGFTSGLNETVDEPAPASFTHRIDLVLTRSTVAEPMPADKPLIVGADPANRTAGGLWPSDHAGVVVRVRP